MLTTYSFDLEITLPILGPGNLQFGDLETELEIGYSVDGDELHWWIEKVRVRAYDSREKRFIGYWLAKSRAIGSLGEDGSSSSAANIISHTVERHDDTRQYIKEAAWAHYREADVDTRREDRAVLNADAA